MDQNTWGGWTQNRWASEGEASWIAPTGALLLAGFTRIDGFQAARRLGDSDGSCQTVRSVVPDAPSTELPLLGRRGAGPRALAPASGSAIFYEASSLTPFLVTGVPSEPEVLQLQDACENTSETMRGARLFTLGGHAVVAVVSREMVQQRVADTDTSPFGICVCDSTLIDTVAVPDYLTVYQIHFRGLEQAPELLPLLRQTIGEGEGAQSFGFSRDAGGELDFWYGPQLLGSEQSVSEYPPRGSSYVIEHFGTE